MLSGNQKQIAGENALAVQAGRDIYVGMSFSEVKELVHLFLRDNFPKLREEAKVVAEERVQTLLSTFERRLAQVVDRIDATRFREPDVQAAINDAVVASARRGADANPDVLCALIAERVAVDPSKFKDMVVSEAVQVVPRLTAVQIKLLVSHPVVRHFQTSKNSHIFAGYEGLAHATDDFLDASINDISPVQISHIRYTGALEVSGGAFAFDIFEHLHGQNSHLGIKETKDFKGVLGMRSPKFVILIERHNNLRLGNYGLTSVGRAIALASLTAVFPNLDYNEWLF